MYDEPIRYMERTRSYYAALGYPDAYRWAHHDDAPFAPLSMPLRETKVALITTAAPFQPELGDQGPWAEYNAAAKFHSVYSKPANELPDLRISHVGYDRKHTSAEDMRTWFPLAALWRETSSGRVGSIAARFHGVPTTRSQRQTTEIDAPEVLARCREDGVDAAVLVPV